MNDSTIGIMLYYYAVILLSLLAGGYLGAVMAVRIADSPKSMEDPGRSLLDAIRRRKRKCYYSSRPEAEADAGTDAYAGMPGPEPAGHKPPEGHPSLLEKRLFAEKDESLMEFNADADGESYKDNIIAKRTEQDEQYAILKQWKDGKNKKETRV